MGTRRTRLAAAHENPASAGKSGRADARSHEAWTSAEITQLKSLASECQPVAVIALTLQRTVADVKRTCKKLRVNLRLRSRGPWNTERIARLRALVAEGTARTEIARQLEVPVASVYGMCRQLRLVQKRKPRRVLTGQEIDTIATLASKGVNNCELHRLLGRSLVVIRKVRKSLGIPAAGTHGEWTDEDVAALKKMYQDSAIDQIAARLHRTTHSIIQKARKLHLKRKKGWSEQDVELLKTLVQSRASQDSIAAALDRSVYLVRRKCMELNLQFGKRGSAPRSSAPSARLRPGALAPIERRRDG